MSLAPWSQLTREEKRLRLIRSWRLAAPTLVTIMTLLLMLLPVWIQGPLLPQVGLLGVSYWAISRPALMPPVAAFTIGLMQDLWLGMPLGVNAMLLMITALVLAGQHRVFVSRPFGFAWLMMIPVVLLHAMAGWGLAAVAGRSTQLVPLMVQSVLTLLLYPMAGWLHGRVQRLIVDPYLQQDEY